MYNINCCGMIAMKREVAAHDAGFPWSECQVKETDDKSLYKQYASSKTVKQACERFFRDTHGEVYSHRLSY